MVWAMVFNPVFLQTLVVSSLSSIELMQYKSATQRTMSSEQEDDNIKIYQVKKMTDYKRILVTAALPYANGPVHIGHMAGVYVPADIYVRYQRARKREIKFVCGSDEHGVPITIRAMKEGVTPQQIVDKYHAQIKESFEQMGISFDIYSRTSNKVHHETA